MTHFPPQDRRNWIANMIKVNETSMKYNGTIDTG